MVKSLPTALLDALDGVAGFDREAFVQVHASGSTVTSLRRNPNKVKTELPVIGVPESSTIAFEPVRWSEYGFYVAPRPSFTFDPLFHAGAYYVQEASSMFLEQAIRQLAPEGPLRVLDLCAAPGGKSTHLQVLLSSDSLLVSNEVIRTRVPVLTDNIIRWGGANVVVTNNDPAAFARLEGFFDVLVVDAPCSGSGLFRKDPDAIDEWSPANVQLCSGRQQRILADALPCLKEGGLLVYSTCSFSPEEDEVIADWLVGSMDMENRPLQVDTEWGVIPAISPVHRALGYRFYPDKVKGEGFFLSAFSKTAAASPGREKKAGLEKATAKEAAILRSWTDRELEFLRNGDQFFAISPEHFSDFGQLRAQLHVTYAGLRMGAIMKDRLVPDHALALSQHLSAAKPYAELSYEMAIRYLQRQDIQVEAAEKGWQTVRYQGQALGWVNVLPNRVNNYYPKEIRILKQSN